MCISGYYAAMDGKTARTHHEVSMPSLLLEETRQDKLTVLHGRMGHMGPRFHIVLIQYKKHATG